MKTGSMAIPTTIDVLALINELNGYGLRDHAIEIVCGLTQGYVAQVRCGNIKRPNYEYAAKIYNLAEQERLKVNVASV